MTNHMSALDWIVNGIAAAAFLGFLVFIIIYAAFANWRSTAPGRALMYAIGSLNVMVLMATVHLFTGRYPGIEFVRSVVYLLLFLSAWRLVWTLVKILRQGQPITVETFVQRKPAREKEKNSMIEKLAEYRKAIAAFLVPGLTVLGAALSDGVVTPQEWIAVAIASLGTSIVVGVIPNALTDAQVIKGAGNLAEPTAVAAALVSEENRRNSF